MSEWLAKNLELAYPFDDSVTDMRLAALFADALVSARTPGPYSLTVFDPQAFFNGRVQIKVDTTVVYDVIGMSATTLGDYTVLQGIDSVLGSSFRFIVSTAKLVTFPNLTTPTLFVPQVCNFIGDHVDSLQGLTGDVTISIDKFLSTSTDDNGSTVLTAEDPVDRVECSDSLAEVLTINGVKPDERGSFILSSDGCYRLVPDPDNASQLSLVNFCQPCVSTELVQTINNRIGEQASYFYQLGAIYVDQFNRYQQLVAKKNAQLTSASSRMHKLTGAAGTGPTITPDSLIDVNGRSFNRPYFSQLSLGLINSSPYQILITLTVTIGALDTISEKVPNSGIQHRFIQSGKTSDVFPPFPGTHGWTLDQRDVVSLSSEIHMTDVRTDSPKSGEWHVNATVTFLAGPGALPSPFSIFRSFPIEVLKAEFTMPPVVP